MSDTTKKRTNPAQRGQGLTEYAVVLSLVALAGIFSVTLLGSSLRAKFGQLTGQVIGEKDVVNDSNKRMSEELKRSVSEETKRAANGIGKDHGLTNEQSTGEEAAE